MANCKPKVTVKRKTKDPYCVKYKVKDRFGSLVNGKRTFKSYNKAFDFAAKVYNVEKKSNGVSAKLVTWGTNK